MSGWGDDFRDAVRRLRRSAGFTATAALVLALSIAANSLAFSFVNSVLLRPLPVREPERLVRVYTSYREGPRYFSVSGDDYLRLEELAHVFSGVVADEPSPVRLGEGGRHERVWAYHVSANYFAVLGLAPAVGRFFLPGEVDAAGRSVAVLSHGLWQRRFGGSLAVVGRTVDVNGRAFTVIGVAPPAFHGVNTGLRPELWIPVRIEDRGPRGYFVLARLQPGVGVRAARDAVGALGERLREERGATREGVSLTLLPESEGGVHPLVRGAFRDFSALLATAMGMVLLLASSNVAGLQLARAAARRRELAVRLAIGASRFRIVRQLLAESALVWLVAGASGTGLAALLVEALTRLELPTDRPLFVDIAMDVRVLGFSLAATSLTGVLFGLVPALAASRPDLAQDLKHQGHGRGARSPLRAVLVAGQVALSVVLLIGAGLCLRSLTNAREIALGFDQRGVAMASLDLELQGYDARAAGAFWDELLSRLRAQPGVAAAGLTNRVPFQLNLIRIPVAAAAGEGRALPSVDFAVVDAGYFDALRIRVRDGRAFRSAPDAAPEVVVNQTLAQRLWPGARAVGRSLRAGGTSYRVAGVVEDGKYLTLGEDPTPFLYLRFASSPAAMTVLVRRAAPEGADAAALLPGLRGVVSDLDAGLPLYAAKTMQEHLAIALLPAGVGAGVLGSFSALALLLASVGLYGLLAHAVALRTHEIGVRRALGARNGDVVVLVAARALGPVVIGLFAGLGLAGAGFPAARALLYGIGPRDPAAYSIAVGTLLLTAAIACFLPAARAARLEPMTALRED